MLALKALFGASCAALAWTHVVYPLGAAALARVQTRRVRKEAIEPHVTVIVAAYNEEPVIERRLENLVALDYPADRLELVVTSDISTDRTQLWNIVRGDMSLVGSWPTLRYQVERYSERQRHGLGVPPGITGWAKIHGRASLSWEERIELDVWYVEHRSTRTDALILLRAPFALFGATHKGEISGWQQ